MQSMDNTTLDGPLTGVHLPNNRGSGARVGLSTFAGIAHRRARRGTKAAVYITARGLDGVVYGPIVYRIFLLIFCRNRKSGTKDR